MKSLHSILALPAKLLFVLSVFLILNVRISEAGTCTAESFDNKAQQCVRQLYDRLTNGKLLNCSLAYKTLVFCLEDERDGCWRALSPSCTPKEIHTKAKEFIASEDFYCKMGTLHSFEAGSIKGCSAEFSKKAEELSRKFASALEKRTNSSRLCESFSEATHQIKQGLLDDCEQTKEVARMRAVYANKFNPFCSRKGVSFLERSYGRCTVRSYHKRQRECIAEFVRKIKEQDCAKNCNTSIASFQSCKGEVLMYCLHDHFKDKKRLTDFKRGFIERTTTQDQRQLCQGVNMVPAPAPRHCKNYRYMGEIEKCAKQAYQAFRKSICDPSLSGKYAAAKTCAKKVVETMCPRNQYLDTFAQFYYDDFNPFSPTLRDPEETITERNPQETTPTPTTNTTIPSEGHREPPVVLLAGLSFLVYLFL